MKLTRAAYNTIKDIVDTHGNKEGTTIIMGMFGVGQAYAHRLYLAVKYNEIEVMK